MSEANKALARRYFEELSNDRRLEIADAILTADHVYHDPQIPNVVGPKAMADTIAVYQNGVEGHWHIEEMVAEGDRVVTRWTGTGKHTGNVMGLPPTGKSVNVAAITVQRVVNGKIAETWTVWDTLGFLQQLGAIPAAAPA